MFFDDQKDSDDILQLKCKPKPVTNNDNDEAINSIAPSKKKKKIKKSS